MWNGTAIKEIGFHNHIHILEHRPEDIQTDEKTNTEEKETSIDIDNTES